MLFKNKTMRGFSLIELILVLGISSIAFIGLLNFERKKAEFEDAQNFGAKYVEIGEALGDYIARENVTIRTQLTAAGQESPALNINLLRLGAGTTSGYNNIALLPATYNNIGPFGTNIQIYLRRETVGGNDVIRGLVISNVGITDGTGAIRYDYAGNMVRKMGPQGGMIFPAANTMSGQGGAWTLTSANFTQITALGKVGYRVQFQGIADGTYLRLDGASVMQGDLNMGNFSITNATDVTYNGWLYGNNAVFNNVITGNITNSGNIATRTIVGDTAPDRTAQAAIAGVALVDRPYANFNTLYTSCINCGFNAIAKASPPGVGVAAFNAANGDVQIGSTGGGTNNQGTLFVKDIVLGNGSSRGAMSNSNLSDRLPRYADRGVILVNQDQAIAKPAVLAPGSWAGGYACNHRGVGTVPVPKIELIPAAMYVQGRVLGNIGIAVNNNGNLPPGYYVVQDQYTVSSLRVRADDAGANWIVRIETPVYDPAFVGGQALAHIYCDYGP